MAEPIPTPPKAGEAYLRAIESDPESKMGLMRARMHLMTVATIMSSPEFQAALDAQRVVSGEWAEALRRSVERLGDELKSLHLPRPRTLEDWQVLGRIVEIPEEYLQNGGWTAAELFDRAMAWGQREKIRARLAADVRAEREVVQATPTADPPKRRKPKRSTERGEGQEKLVAALTKYHQYADGSCLNAEPIGNNELADLAEVSTSTASEFFRTQFGGHTKYRALCQDVVRLIAALKLLNQEFTPQQLFGKTPPDKRPLDD